MQTVIRTTKLFSIEWVCKFVAIFFFLQVSRFYVIKIFLYTAVKKFSKLFFNNITCFNQYKMIHLNRRTIFNERKFDELTYEWVGYDILNLATYKIILTYKRKQNQYH